MPRFRSTPLDPPGIDTLLRAAGYVEDGETVIFLAPSAALAAADADVIAGAAPDEDWIAVIATTEYQIEARRDEKRDTPARLAAPGTSLTLRQNGAAAASLSVVADAPFAGFFDLAVRPEHRRRGLAQRIVRAGALWAARHGADWLFARVAESNAASRALCTGLGMREATAIATSSRAPRHRH